MERLFPEGSQTRKDMSQENAISNNQVIMLTTGIYDLIKEHIRRKKATPAEEEMLRIQLKNAMQVRRKHLPANVVTINTRVRVNHRASGQESVHHFVAPDKSKKRNNTESILSPMGLALVGCQEGDSISWPFGEGVKQLEILSVERRDG